MEKKKFREVSRLTHNKGCQDGVKSADWKTSAVPWVGSLKPGGGGALTKGASQESSGGSAVEKPLRKVLEFPRRRKLSKIYQNCWDK